MNVEKKLLKIEQIADKASAKLAKSRDGEYFKVLNANAKRKATDNTTLKVSINKLSIERDKASDALAAARVKVKKDGTLKIANNVGIASVRDSASRVIKLQEVSRKALVTDNNIADKFPQRVIDNFVDSLMFRADKAIADYKATILPAAKRVSAFAKLKDCAIKATQLELECVEYFGKHLNEFAATIVEVKAQAKQEAQAKFDEEEEIHANAKLYTDAKLEENAPALELMPKQAFLGQIAKAA